MARIATNFVMTVIKLCGNQCGIVCELVGSAGQCAEKTCSKFLSRINFRNRAFPIQMVQLSLSGDSLKTLITF